MVVATLWRGGPRKLTGLPGQINTLEDSGYIPL